MCGTDVSSRRLSNATVLMMDIGCSSDGMAVSKYVAIFVRMVANNMKPSQDEMKSSEIP